MALFTCQRYTDYHLGGMRSKQRHMLVEPPPSPLLICPGQHHYGFDAFRIRFVPDHLNQLRGV
jgi:hypothetical protein